MRFDLPVLEKHAPTAAALLLCLAHFATFDLRTQPIVTDIRCYLYLSWLMTQGAVPHLDFFDVKTQLSTFTGTLFYHAGEMLGVSPLVAIRVGYLGIAVFGGMLTFFVFRRLGKGSSVAGFLGLLAYCSFGLLGLMPAVGNIPKLWMAVFASATALLVRDRRWFWAGVCGALAFMDWQVGVLAWLGALVPALVYGSPRRRAGLRVVAGGAAGVAPFVGYYALHGALLDAVHQTVVSTFFLGAATPSGLGDRLDAMGRLVRLACPGQEWLFFASLFGMGFVGYWLWRWRRTGERVLLLSLGVYHFGVVAFSLTNFQWYGDFFLLLHSVAFFLAAAWVGIYGIVAAGASPRRRGLLVLVALVLAFAFARPSLLRPRFELVTPYAAPGATLNDQESVAAWLRAHIGEGEAVFLDHWELPFLMRYPSAALPIVYWNSASWARYRKSPEEPPVAAGLRILRSIDPDVLAVPSALRSDREFRGKYQFKRIASENGKYASHLYLRSR